ncbi:MAG: hypothetical protein KGP10_01535 [Actinomycetales bacterium]|nr:hypothetical protein [Actinomycetales bacterium]
MSVPTAEPTAGPTAGRLILLLLLMPGGFLLGLVMGFYPQAIVRIGPVPLPWGLVLSIVVVALAVRLPVRLLRTRLAGVLVLIGWGIASIALALPTPDGDLILADGWQTYAYLTAGVLLGGFLVALPPRAGSA